VRSDTGHTFGGYASVPWKISSCHTNAAGCFLFLVENPHGDAPTCFECKDDGHAIAACSNHGPQFGWGDLTIPQTFPNPSNPAYMEKGGSIGFPSSYTDTLGRGNATFTGAKKFNLEDYEVWAAT
jgi:hypothetical protein